MAKRRRVPVYSPPPPLCFRFRTRFEEKKICGYLTNMINSVFLSYKPFALLYFSADVLGEKAVISLLKKENCQLPEKYTYETLFRNQELEVSLPKKTAVRCLREGVLPVLRKRLLTLSRHYDNEFQRRLLNLQKTFRLSEEEGGILFFYYLLDTSSALYDYLRDPDRGIIGFGSFLAFKNYGHYVLGSSRAVHVKTLSKGTLLKTQLLKLNEADRDLELNDWCRSYLSGVGKSNLEHEFFNRDNDAALGLSDFELPADELFVLNYLLRRKGKCNILFYGLTGTGKTSLAKTLAKEYGKELLTVKMPDDDEHKNRVQAIHATVNLAGSAGSVILIDEADDILNTQSFFYERRINKSWVNNFLDSHGKKIIWITNDSGQIHPSTMRRFSFSREFKRLTAKNRLRVLQHELEQKGLRGFFTEHELSDLCRDYSVDAGGIVNAMNIFKISRKQQKEAVLRKIRTVLKNHEKATGGKNDGNQKERDFDAYTLSGLNTSHNLKEILTLLKSDENRPAIKNMSVALLLYGRPGTGKSEFVYYLGHKLGKEVLLKRASNIQSMWVGGSEKNIANAFAEAQESGSILFFDEADTFLFPRASAQRSWEISFTNELLTQLESYKGIAVFATNDMEGLDHAALRRFKFKIEFKSLKPEGILHFYNKLLCPLVQRQTDLSGQELVQLKNFSGLTPGDFAVVKDQLLFVDPAAVTHERLIEALRGEVRHKKNEQGIKGFAACE